jgi:hypothetical protein
VSLELEPDGLDGLVLDEPLALEGLELDGLELEPALLDLSLDEELLELGLDGLVLEEPDMEPDGEDGEVDDAPREDELLAPLSQPYRPLTATAMGRRTNADFLSKLIWTLLSVGKLGLPPTFSS